MLTGIIITCDVQDKPFTFTPMPPRHAEMSCDSVPQVSLPPELVTTRFFEMSSVPYPSVVVPVEETHRISKIIDDQCAHCQRCDPSHLYAPVADREMRIILYSTTPQGGSSNLFVNPPPTTRGADCPLRGATLRLDDPIRGPHNDILPTRVGNVHVLGSYRQPGLLHRLIYRFRG